MEKDADIFSVYVMGEACGGRISVADWTHSYREHMAGSKLFLSLLVASAPTLFPAAFNEGIL